MQLWRQGSGKPSSKHYDGFWLSLNLAGNSDLVGFTDLLRRSESRS